MTYSQTTRTTERRTETTRETEIHIQTQNARQLASQELGQVIERWTELAGSESPITRIQLAMGLELHQIEHSRQHFEQLGHAAEIARESLRIVEQPALSMMLGTEQARTLEQRTHRVIHAIAMTTLEQEHSQSMQELRSLHAELRGVESKLQSSVNLLSSRNREIDKKLMTLEARSELSTETSHSWSVGSVEYKQAIAYISVQELARLQHQAQQGTRSQDLERYNLPDPPLAVVEAVVAETDIENPPIQPIAISLLIEGAGEGQGFRAVLTVGNTTLDPFRLLPLREAQVVEFGKRIRTAIRTATLLNSKHYKYYIPGNTFSQAELQQDWKDLAETGAAVLEEIFDQSALKILQEHLRPAEENADRPPVSFRIETENFFLPWEMLAWPARFENEPLESRFWGFLYNITRSVIDAGQKVTKPQLIADTQPDLLLFTLQDEDPQFSMMEGLPTPLNLTRVGQWDKDDREHEIEDLSQYLARPLHVVHFGCHAEGADREENAKFEVNKEFDLKLYDFLKPEYKLLGNPLVFLNACATGIFGSSSRETLTTTEENLLAPKVAADFVRVFLRNLGACGVIATEYEIPMDFAPEFAREFYTRFLGGEHSAGEALLGARQEFLRKRHNPLGLFFSAYLEPETRISIIHPTRSVHVNLATHTFITAEGNTSVQELSSAFESQPEYVLVLPAPNTSAVGYLPFAVLTMVPPETTLREHPGLQTSTKDQVLLADTPENIQEQAIMKHGMLILTRHGVPVKILTPGTLGEETHLPVSLSNDPLRSDRDRETCPECHEPAERVVTRIKGRFIYYCSNCAQEWK